MENNKKDKKIVLVHLSLDLTFDELIDAEMTLGELIEHLKDTNRMPQNARGDACVSNSDNEEVTDLDSVLRSGAVVKITGRVVDMHNTDEEFKRKLKEYVEGKLDPATDGGFSERLEKIQDILPKLLGEDIEKTRHEKSQVSRSRRSRQRRTR